MNSYLPFAGVLAALEMRRVGFPTRMRYEHFLRRYAVVLPLAKRNRFLSSPSSIDVKKEVRDCTCAPSVSFMSTHQVRGMLLHPLFRGTLTENCLKFGRTKVFARANVLASMDSRLRKYEHQSATQLQSLFRGRKCQQQFASIKQSALCVQSRFRGYLVRKKWRQLVIEHRETLKLLRLKEYIADGETLIREAMRKAVDEDMHGVPSIVQASNACRKALSTARTVADQGELKPAEVKYDLFVSSTETLRQIIEVEIEEK